MILELTDEIPEIIFVVCNGIGIRIIDPADGDPVADQCIDWRIGLVIHCVQEHGIRRLSPCSDRIDVHGFQDRHIPREDGGVRVG